MNKNNLLITGVASLVALVAVTGVAMSTFASEGDVSYEGDTIRTRANSFVHRNLSDEEKQEREENREERRAEMEEKREAVIAALDANDYDAWVVAAGEDSPLLEKVTVDNFSRFIEAHELRQSARADMEEADLIFEELGIEKKKFGPNMKGGRGGGMHRK